MSVDCMSKLLMMMERSASHCRRCCRFICILATTNLVTSYLGGLCTCGLIHPARWARPRRCLADNHLVKSYPGGLCTCGLIHPPRCRQKGEGMLVDVEARIAPPTFAHMASHPQHVVDVSHRVPIPFLGCRCRRPLGHRPGNGEGLAFHPSFYLLTDSPCHPAPRLSSGCRPRTGLHGTRQNWSSQTIQILSKSHPAAAGMVDGTASDCLPT